MGNDGFFDAHGHIPRKSASSSAARVSLETVNADVSLEKGFLRQVVREVHVAAAQAQEEAAHIGEMRRVDFVECVRRDFLLSASLSIGAL
ncbi:MAG: hypothetical protein FWH26_06160 [Oscillospiraceae bacterium]|nr:hypothetical protein [Oscillospiraceae bacterium]